MSAAFKTVKKSSEEMLLDLIEQKKYLLGIKTEAIAKALYISRTTMYNRLNAPATFSFTELNKLFRYLNFSREEIGTLIDRYLEENMLSAS